MGHLRFFGKLYLMTSLNPYILLLSIAMKWLKCPVICTLWDTKRNTHLFLISRQMFTEKKCCLIHSRSLYTVFHCHVVHVCLQHSQWLNKEIASSSSSFWIGVCIYRALSMSHIHTAFYNFMALSSFLTLCVLHLHVFSLIAGKVLSQENTFSNITWCLLLFQVFCTCSSSSPYTVNNPFFLWQWLIQIV